METKINFYNFQFIFLKKNNNRFNRKKDKMTEYERFGNLKQSSVGF